MTGDRPRWRRGALSWLQGLSEYHVFVGLMTKRGLTPEMGRDVFEALRHGIAHVYDTKYVQFGTQKIELIVSWGQKEQLAVRRDPPGLYVVVRTLWNDLEEVFSALGPGIERTGTLPSSWVRDSVGRGRPQAVQAWAAWIKNAREG